MNSEAKKNLIGAIMMYSAFIIIYLQNPSDTTDPELLADASMMAPFIWGFYLLLPFVMMFVCAILEMTADILPGGNTDKGNAYLILSSVLLFFVLAM